MARLAFVAPMVLPPYAIALAWVALSEKYWPGHAYGLQASIVALTFSFYPLVMLASEAALRSVSSPLEDAARLVASSARVWRKIILPSVMPSVVASTLVVFVLAISDFAIASMLRVRVYTTEVFTAFSALYDFRLATVLALPLALTGAVVSVAALRIWQRDTTGRAERGPVGRQWRNRTQQMAATLLFTLSSVVVMMPVAVLAAESLTGRAVFSEAASVEAIRNTFFWALTAATVVTTVGALLGYWRIRTNPLAGQAADALWLALFAMPATVAGIGIIGLFNRPGFFGDLYRTDAIVLLAYVSRFLPIAALLCAAFLRRVPPAAEEAAIVGGASWGRTLTRIVLPLASRGLAAVWLVVFILMFGDVSLAVLVAPPGESNLPVRAYTLMANSPVGDVARIALVQMALTALPLTAIFVLLHPRRAT
jgi:iron(III) transport system permease protein